MVPSLLARLGQVRAALDGHGGGISVTSFVKEDDGYYFVLDLTGACLSCGAAPGTLQGVKNDLENDYTDILDSISEDAEESWARMKEAVKVSLFKPNPSLQLFLI